VHDIDHQTDVRDKLEEIIEVASSRAREGASARDIVVQIVVALEDCSLFNAGKGAVLTQDGEHEVSLSKDAVLPLSRLLRLIVLTV